MKINFSDKLKMSTEPVTVQPPKQRYLRELKSTPSTDIIGNSIINRNEPTSTIADTAEKQPAVKNKNPSNSSSPVAVSGGRNSGKDSLEKILGGVQVKITVKQMVGSMMIIIRQDFPNNKLNSEAICRPDSNIL